jgi:transposase
VKKSSRSAARQPMNIQWSSVAAVGIDLGDRTSRFVCLDESGKQIGEGSVATARAAVERQFGAIGSKVIAIETGTHSPWFSRLLRELGHQVTVANSRKLRLIYENRNKNDSVDAEYLARLVRVDPKLLSPVEHRSERAQEHIALFRSRDVLVRTRTGLISHVRGTVKSLGMRLPSCAAEAFSSRAAETIPPSLRHALEPVLKLIAELTTQIRSFDRRVERLLEDEYREVKVLTQIKGVGALTAVAYAVTIGDPRRFARSRTAGAWLGLTPGQRASGQQDPQQRITKQGDAYLRWLLVNCAQYILGQFGEDCDLRRHGLAIAARGGKNAKKRAVIAVARKLAVLLHRLWCTQAVYEPLRNHRTIDAA